MKPILFNTEMVQAILNGKKYVTRRLVKEKITKGFDYKCDGTPWYYRNEKDECWEVEDVGPYQVGDILYVRETWSFQECDNCTGNCDTTPPDSLNGKSGCYVYRTNYGTTEDDTFPPSMFKWHPSIHMSKEAARIFLKVTAVRVEKLQDITDKEAKKEGVVVETNNSGLMHKLKFAKLWDSTIDMKEHWMDFGWSAKPWVWVIELERISKEEAI